MKKVFTLLTLLVAIVTGASAATSWWKASSATVVEANTTYVDDALLTVKTVFAGTLGTYAHDYSETEKFTHNIQVRVAALPTDGTKTGTEQSGSTPLVITANKNVTITIYYRRQKANSALVSNDSKDVLLIDQETVAEILGPISFEATADGDYGYAKKTYTLTKGHTYTLCQKGTTIGFQGLSYEENEISVPGNYDFTTMSDAAVSEYVASSTWTGDEVAAKYQIVAATRNYFSTASDVSQIINMQFVRTGSNMSAGNIEVYKKSGGNNGYLLLNANTATACVPNVPANTVVRVAFEANTTKTMKLSGNVTESTTSGLGSGKVVYVYAKTNADGMLRIEAPGAGVKVYSIEFNPTETITLGTNGYSTFAGEENFTVTGATAYTAAFAESKVTLTALEAEDVVAAGKGIVLKGTEGDEVTITYTAADATVTSTGLEGVISSTTGSLVGDYQYVVASNGAQTAFVQAPAGVTLDQLRNKAYLSLTADQYNSISALPINFEEVTAVQNVEAAPVANEAQVGQKAFVNGRLVIITENGVVNALGQSFK